MARVIGNVKLKGTIDNLTYYEMDGECFVRAKSSLTGKRFWKDKAFERSRRSCALLKQASPLASSLYKLLPKESKGRKVFNALTGKIKLLLRDGWDEQQIRAWVKEEYLAIQKDERPVLPATPPRPLIRKTPPARRDLKTFARPGYDGCRAGNMHTGAKNRTITYTDVILPRQGRRYRSKAGYQGVCISGRSDDG